METISTGLYKTYTATVVQHVMSRTRTRREEIDEIMLSDVNILFNPLPFSDFFYVSLLLQRIITCQSEFLKFFSFYERKSNNYAILCIEDFAY